MGLTAVSLFTPELEPAWAGIGFVAGVFVLVGLPSIWIWAALSVMPQRPR